MSSIFAKHVVTQPI